MTRISSNKTIQSCLCQPKSPRPPPFPYNLLNLSSPTLSCPTYRCPRRGPKCKLGYHHVFNLILLVLYTGRQCKCLPVPKTPDGTDAIPYSTVYKVFARWSEDGSLEQAFVASVVHLSAHNQLDLSILHGDGTHTVAKKGGDGICYSGHKHQKGEKIIAIVDKGSIVGSATFGEFE